MTIAFDPEPGGKSDRFQETASSSVGLDRVFEVFDNEIAALQSFAKP
jgi:hypothetical protein